jgi:Flp pilus assembly pilin Flp
MMALLRGEEGVSALEYALIAGAIALAIVTFLVSMGQSLNHTFSTVAAAFR